MTSLVVWSGADSRGPASLNIASDSRISWSGNGERRCWDQAQKVYAAGSVPLLIGYVGDVLFPSLVLPSLIDRIDHGLFRADGEVVDGVLSILRQGWKSYPQQEQRSVTFYLGRRQSEAMSASFELHRLSVDASGKWNQEGIPVPAQSARLAVVGTGRSAMVAASDRWQTSTAAGTSRAVFSAFIDALDSGSDPSTGGSPQLGCLYRVGPGRLLGIVHRGQRHYAGAPLIGDEEVEVVEWRNSLFERTDGRSRSRLRDAKAQPRPQGIGQV